VEKVRKERAKTTAEIICRQLSIEPCLEKVTFFNWPDTITTFNLNACYDSCKQSFMENAPMPMAESEFWDRVSNRL